MCISKELFTFINNHLTIGKLKKDISCEIHISKKFKKKIGQLPLLEFHLK